MDLALSSEQEALREAVARFVTEEIGIETIVEATLDDEGIAPSVWRQMAELGWFALAVGEEHDGLDAARGDIAVVFEELGAGPVAGPLLETGVLVPDVVRALGPSPLADELLPAIAAGTAIVTAGSGLLGPPTSGDLHLGGSGSSRLQGSVDFVREAALATHHLVVARQGSQQALVLVDAMSPGVRLERMNGAFPRLWRIVFDDVAVAADHVIELPPERMAVVRTAAMRSVPLYCSYQVGSCRSVYDMTLRYSRERVQFGKPIGTFQRVQDHVIDIVNALDAARWTTAHAVWALETAAASLAPVHVAKIATSEAHYTACTAAHEVHAGIGSDVQYGLAVHTYTSRVLFGVLGDPAWHRRQLAVELELAS